jgi:hypothetical protein
MTLMTEEQEDSLGESSIQNFHKLKAIDFGKY